MSVLDLKYRRLLERIRSMESAVVAFSGGVDSSLLAAVACKTLGVRATAVTLDSPTLPRRELREAVRTAKTIGVRHVVIKHSELSNRSLVKNTRNRCYHCKSMLSKVLGEYASKNNIRFVIEGTNATELRGHRPGFRALRRKGVSSPLAEAGLTRVEVRKLARRLGLPNHDKPSTACLSSRIPYCRRITQRTLRMVESAEDFLLGLGVRQIRVRCFDWTAVIETYPQDLPKILENRASIGKRLKEFGFKRVAVDLEGYRTGSMN